MIFVIPRRLYSRKHEGGKPSRGSWNTGTPAGVRICRESLFTVKLPECYKTGRRRGYKINQDGSYIHRIGGGVADRLFL